ncbi:hypothetical protein IWX47DRAFT_188326 [Phyllosticta citricarpa]|uniref:Uncharacterized protein n=1 Tax=Phyllosticta citricarpa TaxID=55181 RepID=A0ABR1MLR8_9PEZI
MLSRFLAQRSQPQQTSLSWQKRQKRQKQALRPGRWPHEHERQGARAIISIETPLSLSLLPALLDSTHNGPRAGGGAGAERSTDGLTDRALDSSRARTHARTHALRLTAVCLTDDDESIDVAVAVAVRCRGESSRERQRRCRADIVRGVHDHGGSNCSKHHAHTRVSSSTSTCRTNHASQATSQSANKARCQKASFVRVSPRQQQARAQTALAHPSALPSIITSSSSSNNRK